MSDCICRQVDALQEKLRANSGASGPKLCAEEESVLVACLKRHCDSALKCEEVTNKFTRCAMDNSL